MTTATAGTFSTNLSIFNVIQAGGRPSGFFPCCAKTVSSGLMKLSGLSFEIVFS